MALALLVGLLRRLVIELVDLVGPRRILLAGLLLADRLDAVADLRAESECTVPSMTRSF
jgi:hypothetical protein